MNPLLLDDVIEVLWIRGKELAGNPRDRRRPSKGIAAVLTALLDGEAYGREIARRTGQAQPNVTASWLPKLELYGFVAKDIVPGLGHQGGGRPAQVWRLTRKGKELAELLREEAKNGGSRG